MSLYNLMTGVVDAVVGIDNQTTQDLIATSQIEFTIGSEFSEDEARRTYASIMHTTKLSQYLHSNLDMDEYINKVIDWEYAFIGDNKV